jgi:hypothetical protein
VAPLSQRDKDGFDSASLLVTIVGAAIVGAGYLIRELGVEDAHMFGLVIGVPVAVIGIALSFFGNNDDIYFP